MNKFKIQLEKFYNLLSNIGPCVEDVGRKNIIIHLS